MSKRIVLWVARSRTPRRQHSNHSQISLYWQSSVISSDDTMVVLCSVNCYNIAELLQTLIGNIFSADVVEFDVLYIE